MQIVSKIILCKKVFEGPIVLVSDFFLEDLVKEQKTFHVRKTIICGLRLVLDLKSQYMSLVHLGL